jgi:hypothetical protein
MIPFVKHKVTSKEEEMYIMTFRVAHWDTLDDGLVF